MTKFLEHTIEAEKLFLVSLVHLFFHDLLSLFFDLLSLLQSISKQMEAKNNYLRKFLPLVRSMQSLAREKELAKKRVAEACAESQAELRSLHKEVRAQQE